MAVKVVFQKDLMQKYAIMNHEDKLEILNKAFDVLQNRSYGTKAECICIAMGYKLYNMHDKSYIKDER